MELVPCEGCKRHVRLLERVCPFCGRSTIAAAVKRPLLGGRLSRAAVFASATLTGCYTSTPAPPTPPPAPPPRGEMRAQHADPWQSSNAPVDPAPLPPVPVQTPPPPPPPPPPPNNIAKPPAVTGTGEIVGRVRDSNGDEVGRVEVWLYDRNGERERQVAKPTGTFRFRQLPAERYRLRIVWTPGTPHSPPTSQQMRNVDLADGQRQIVDIVIPAPRPVRDRDFDRGPCCKPYGAPPARRRVV